MNLSELTVLFNEFKTPELKETSIEELYEALGTYGASSVNIHIMIDNLVERGEIKRGLYSAIVEHASNSPQDVTAATRSVVKHKDLRRVITTDKFRNDIGKYSKKVKCYAIMETYFSSKKPKGMNLMKWLQEQTDFVPYNQIEDLIHKNPETYAMDPDIQNFRSGVCINAGWVILTEIRQGVEYWKLTPIGWNGKDIPAGKESFVDYIKHSKLK